MARWPQEPPVAATVMSAVLKRHRRLVQTGPGKCTPYDMYLLIGVPDGGKRLNYRK